MKNTIKTIVSIPFGILGLASLVVSLFGTPEESDITRSHALAMAIWSYICFLMLNWHHTPHAKRLQKERRRLTALAMIGAEVESQSPAMVERLLETIARSVQPKCRNCGSSDIDITRS